MHSTYYLMTDQELTDIRDDLTTCSINAGVHPDNVETIQQITGILRNRNAERQIYEMNNQEILTMIRNRRATGAKQLLNCVN